MFSIKWHCFAGPVLAAAAKKCSRLLLAVTAGAAALGPVSTALATNYYDLVAQGYRWAAVDGPYASPTKDDLRRPGPQGLRPATPGSLNLSTLLE